ncbi:MAG TPA: transcription antitermination factor NusB [Acidobacteriaceae bacterium]|nr:transcription antitermination factor NusB [Terriglobia bacterium]HVC91836.1 transcription antitermination factor NusB [Acidobacteriaceae bacterium]
MSKRRKSREIAMQMLFQADLGKQHADEVRRTFWQARENVDSNTQGFAEDIFRVAIERQEEIDTYIATASEHWRLERMAAVDRNLLRAAIAEMLAYPATPLPIIINESLEIARMYSAPESVHFLNGILDAVARALPRTAKQLAPRPAKETPR